MKIEMNFIYKMDNFNLSVKWNSSERRIGILGASGCGKSMTLKILAGIVTPDSGKIIVNGKTYFDSEKNINIPPQQRKIGYLFQNYALFPTMTIEQNIGMGLLSYSKKDRRDKINNLISRLHLEELRHHYPHELSGGQQQRVALARILAYEPEIILLDEPFSALDSFLKEKLIKELQDILESYTGTMIIVSHDMNEIYTLSNYLFILEKGNIIEHNYTSNLFKNPVHMESAKLTGLKNISPIEKINDYTCYARNWHLTLHTNTEISKDINYIGFHAYDMVSSFKTVENTFAFQIKSTTQTPQSTTYYLQPKLDSMGIYTGEPIYYQQFFNLQKTEFNTIFNYLTIPPDKLYLLL